MIEKQLKPELMTLGGKLHVEICELVGVTTPQRALTQSETASLRFAKVPSHFSFEG